MIGLGRRRAIAIGTLDALIVIFSALFSLGLRFNFESIPAQYLQPVLYCLPIDACFILSSYRYCDRNCRNEIF